MLYELIAVVRPGNLTHVKEIALNTSRTILRSRGVIRGITNWGQFDLPRPTTKHQTQHYQGHYFIVQFDSAASVQNEIKRTLSLDPRMVRFSVVKVADKMGRTGLMEGIEANDGKVSWQPADQFQDLFMKLDDFQSSGRKGKQGLRM